MPVSLFLTSLSQFFLVGSFFLEGDVTQKWKRFLNNNVALVFVGIWVMHLLGMLWTSDIADGLKDLRIKLPILLLPIIVAGTDKLTARQFRWIMGVFIFSVFAGTISAISVLTGFVHREIYDIRDVFIFHISHIRFALFTCVAICTLVYYLFYQKNFTRIAKVVSMCLAIWFVVFLGIVESLTGLIILLIILLSIFVYHVFDSGNKWKKLASVGMIVLLPLLVLVYFNSLIKDFYKMKEISINVNDTTANGNKYSFDLNDTKYENGYPVNVYICYPELKSAWNSRSEINIDSLDLRSQPILSTVIRFLTSKGLRKDSATVYSLTKEEISSIESGKTNVNFQKTSNLKSRFNQVIWEIDNLLKGGNPSGHSVAQRFEFWRASIGIIRANPFFGVGTGDLVVAFHQQYETMQTKLDLDHRLRSHNQYLAITIAFGFPGLIYFVFALLYPLRNYKQLPTIFILFLIICMVSMLTEDTLETQPGATFVGLFFILFYCQKQDSVE